MTIAPTRVRWLLIASIFVIDILMFIDRVNISIAAKHIMPEYGISEVQMGWIFSAFVLGYALLQVPAGWLGDRFGPRLVLAVAIGWWSLFTAVTAIAGELFLTSVFGVVGSFIIVRLLMGVGEAGGPPNRNRLVANWIPPQERGLALGIGTSGSSLGAALTPPLIVWVMVTWGWRAAFYVAGGVGMLFALLWYWIARDRPEEHPWVNAAERAHIGVIAGPQNHPTEPVPWRLLLGRTDLWLLAAAYFVVCYIGYLFFSWFYLYLVNVRGFSLVHGGIYAAAPFLAGALASPLGGWLTDRLSERFGKRIGRCGLAACGLLFAAGWICAGAAATEPRLAVLFFSLGAGSLFLTVAAHFSSTIDLAKAHAGTAGGFMGMGGNLGGVASPTLTPLIANSFGWDSALYVAAALLVLGAFLWIGIHPERALDTERAPSPQPQAAAAPA